MEWYCRAIHDRFAFTWRDRPKRAHRGWNSGIMKSKAIPLRIECMLILITYIIFEREVGVILLDFSWFRWYVYLGDRRNDCIVFEIKFHRIGSYNELFFLFFIYLFTITCSENCAHLPPFKKYYEFSRYIVAHMIPVYVTHFSQCFYPSFPSVLVT